MQMRQLVLASVCLVLAGPAFAQNSNESAVNTQVRAAEAAFMAVGYNKVMGTGSKSLNDDGVDNFSMSLNAGTRYAVFGACDTDCRDLDLKVFGPNGQQLASDVATDDLPTLSFTATQSGSHRLEVKMFNCTVNPCYYAATIAAGGGSSAVNLAVNNTSSNAANRWDAQVNAQLDSFEGRQSSAVRLFRSPIFRLNEGANQDYPVTLVGGVPYKIGGVCDNDCPDLDIQLLDPNGNVVERDALTDSLPIVNFTPKQGGLYRVRVIMYDCNAGPCSAGVTVMAGQ
jgi:Bacterial pre-peptidase C-terminal domain